MPRIRQPFSLLELCYRASGKFVYDDLCCKIERMYGEYDLAACVTVVTIVQRYLLDLLLSVIDDVGLRAIKRHMQLNFLTDCRILYALVIHKSMQSLSVLDGCCKIAQNKFCEFLVNKLPFLTNLTNLELQGIVLTPELLNVIVNNSKTLRCLTVEMPELCSNTISNSEFDQISQLKHLRVLKDSSGHNFNCIEVKVALNFLIRLKNLKEIDYINIEQLLDSYIQINGQCFSSTNRIAQPNIGPGMNPIGLRLTHIKLIASFIPKYDNFDEVVEFEQDPSPKVILTIAQTCPNLEHLELLNFENSKEAIHNQFLENLTTSSIQLSSLMMDGFILNDTFEHFLKEKGKYLKIFLLSPLQVSRNQVQMIQDLCPNVSNVRFSNSCDKVMLPQLAGNNFCIIGGI